jgi:hypothetical protein
MPEMQVFKGVEIIETTQYSRAFLILEDVDSGEIYWQPDSRSTNRKGICHIWIQNRSGQYVVSDVPSAWVLTINGVQQAQELYYDIVLNDRTVELRYDDWRFVSNWRPTSR